MKLAGGAHLTYCSNIHPGETWAQVRENLERYVPAVRAGLAPDEAFGIGLRLSAQAARALNQPAAFEEFRDFLSRNRFYVFTINGFPYGTFHGARVKEDVYLPDWRDERARALQRRAGRPARAAAARGHGGQRQHRAGCLQGGHAQRRGRRAHRGQRAAACGASGRTGGAHRPSHCAWRWSPSRAAFSRPSRRPSAFSSAICSARRRCGACPS